MNPLSNPELETAMSDLSDWQIENDQLTKVFEFDSFRDAISFLVRLSFDIEDMNHHPEIENIENCVRFTICTHESGSKITEKDIKLAERIEDLIQRDSRD